MKYIPQEEADRLEKCKLSGGEIIIVRSGVNAGDTCVVTDEYIGQYAGYDMILVLSSDLHPVFFNTLINTEYMDKVVKPLTRRAAQPHLNSEQTQRLPIIEVPFELQEQFADFVKQVDKSWFVELLQDHGIFDLGLNTDEMDTYYNEFLEQVQDQKQEVIDNQEIILTLQDTSLLNVFHEKTNEEIHNKLEKEISEMFNGIEGEDASKLYDSFHNQIQYA